MKSQIFRIEKLSFIFDFKQKLISLIVVINENIK